MRKISVIPAAVALQTLTRAQERAKAKAEKCPKSRTGRSRIF